MGHALAFDTHAYVKKLVTAGVSEKQAEVQAEALSGLLESNLATKRDIADIKRDIKELEATTKHDMGKMQISLKRDMTEMGTSLKRDMTEMETSLKRDIKELEASTQRDMKELDISLRHEMKELDMRLTIRLGAIMAGGIAIVAALVKLL